MPCWFITANHCVRSSALFLLFIAVLQIELAANAIYFLIVKRVIVALFLSVVFQWNARYVGLAFWNNTSTIIWTAALLGMRKKRACAGKDNDCTHALSRLRVIQTGALTFESGFYSLYS